MPTPKWNESESSRSRDQFYRDTKDSRDWKDRDRDSRERERDKRREKKEGAGKNSKKNKEKESNVEEDQKKLDLDTRIALLLKGKGPGGMAPPFLSFGADSDDDSKNILNSTPKPISIPTSIDSDDGIRSFLIFFIFFTECCIALQIIRVFP